MIGFIIIHFWVVEIFLMNSSWVLMNVPKTFPRRHPMMSILYPIFYNSDIPTDTMKKFNLKIDSIPYNNLGRNTWSMACSRKYLVVSFEGGYGPIFPLWCEIKVRGVNNCAHNLKHWFGIPPPGFDRNTKKHKNNYSDVHNLMWCTKCKRWKYDGDNTIIIARRNWVIKYVVSNLMRKYCIF